MKSTLRTFSSQLSPEHHAQGIEVFIAVGQLVTANKTKNLGHGEVSVAHHYQPRPANVRSLITSFQGCEYHVHL